MMKAFNVLNALRAKLLVTAVLLIVAATQAQDDYVHAPIAAGPWGSAYLMSGLSRMESRDLVISDLRRLAPDAAMLDQDLAGFQQRSSWRSVPNTIALSLNVGTHPFRSADRRGPELRMGIQYASGVVGTLNYERNLRFPLDTLISPSTGAMFVVDSVHTTRYSFSHSAERIGVEGSLIFRTGGRSRWSVFGGAGLGFGVGLNARTELNHEERALVISPGNSRRESIASVEERHNNANGTWVAFQLPVGLSFQLARQGDFLRRMDLFIEERLGMLVQNSSELGGLTNFGAQTLFGLRVRID